MRLWGNHCTFFPFRLLDSFFYTGDAVSELGLRGAELREGGGEVLEFLAELVFDGGELGGWEGGEGDWKIISIRMVF